MSTFRNVPGIGHMVHHAAPDAVLAEIYALSEHRRSPVGVQRRGVERHWLHIGEDGAHGANLGDEDEASSPRRPAAAGSPSPLAAAASAG
jgi:hypothetical protein